MCEGHGTILDDVVHKVREKTGLVAVRVGPPVEPHQFRYKGGQAAKLSFVVGVQDGMYSQRFYLFSPVLVR